MPHERILIEDIYSDLFDRMNRMVLEGGLTDSQLEILESPIRFRQALTSAMNEFATYAGGDLLSPLIRIVSPSGTEQNNLKYYDWPSGAYSVRDDFGIVGVLLGESDPDEYEIKSGFPFQSIQHIAGSPFHTDQYRAFGVNEQARKIYVPKQVTLKLRTFFAPYKIIPSSEGGYWGASVTVGTSPTSDGTIEVSDGNTTLQVEVSSTDTDNEILKAVRDKVNGSSAFRYNAFLYDSTTLWWTHKYDIPYDVTLSPSFNDLDGTGGVLSFTDEGTLELPVHITYHEDIVSLTMNRLVGGPSSDPEQETAEQQDEAEAESQQQ